MCSGLIGDAMLLAQCQGTMYSNLANDDRLRFEQKQNLGTKMAIFPTGGIGFSFVGQKVSATGVCADNAI